jgi:FtsP/CotA-like multicopper oxidase with cupredoxin domain
MRVLIVSLLLLWSHSVLACPWCKTNILQKPTVLPETPDPGGKFLGQIPDPKLTRHYYIAAEPVLWNFLPLQQDPVSKSPLPLPLLQHPTSPKIRYIQYADDQFAVRAVQPDRLGILGPVLRGTVGQYFAVTFLNRSDRPLSMHPHGVKYDKDSEGAAYFPDPGLGASIAPGAKFTYVWKLDESSGPQPGEPSSKPWLYHSHVLADQEVQLGLVGVIIVTDPKRARPDGTPNDIDREMAVYLDLFDESPPADEEEEEEEQANAVPLRTISREALVLKLGNSLQALKRREDSERHAVNGLTYANLTGLEMREGERVRWYLFSLGSERDSHTVHWHGGRVLEDGIRRTDVLDLLPGSMKVADMTADNPGTWLLQCHVADHMMHGMYAHYIVRPRTDAGVASPFFSPTEVPNSIKIKSARAALDFSEGATDPLEFNIAGQMSLFNLPQLGGTPIEIQIGKKKTTLRLNSSGKAQTQDAQFSLRQGRPEQGSLGGSVEFGLTLHGAEWLSQLADAGIDSTSPNGKEVLLPLVLTLDNRPTSAELRLRYKSMPNRKGILE